MGKHLRTLFPGALIKEEYGVWYEGQYLRVDFYLPHLGLAVEVDGRQHDEYVPHFHRTRHAYRAAQRRDWDKTEWADMASLRLLRISWRDEGQVSPEWLMQRLQGMEGE